MEGLYLFGEVLAGFLTLVILVIAFYNYRFNYWRSRNLNNLKPSIPFGNMLVPFRGALSISTHLANYYKETKKLGWKHCGFYVSSNPVYFPIHPDYMQNILIRDFSHFTDRGTYYNEKYDPMSAHLFNLGAAKWRNMRTKLTPTFTSHKMKTMFEMVIECGQHLLDAVEHCATAGEPVDVKEFAARFTTDTIGSCAFGIECNTFKVQDSDFRKYGKRAFSPTNYEVFRAIFADSFKRIARLLGVLHMNKDISGFFSGIIKGTVDYREKNNVTRNDLLQMLIEMKNDKKDPNPLTLDQVTAQSFLFFLGGFETSASTLSFSLYELAKHPDIQDRLRGEVLKVLDQHKGELSYEAVQEMKYMNQVVDEVLRKYPPLPYITRQCVRDYRVPGESIKIEKGTDVYISIMGIHHDPEYYPDPEKFDPERFNEENRLARHSCVWMPFGEGPRTCIGKRFGLLQVKVGLAAIVKKFRLSINQQKTNEPLNIAPSGVVLLQEGIIWLDCEKI